MLPELIDRICKHSYVLALLLAALTFTLVPIHLMTVERGNVVAVRTDNTIEVNRGDLPHADPGELAQVWRFNPDWMKPIGAAEVVEHRDEVVVLRFDPAAFAWPVGRQGTVVNVREGVLELNVGSELGLEPGMQLVLFDQRKNVGRLQVTTTSPRKATARILQLHGVIGDKADPVGALGLQASEFTIPNQVTLLRFGWLPGIEFFAILATLALWLWTVRSPVPGRWLEDKARAGRAAIESAPMGLKRFGWLIYGVPACFVGLQIAGWFWIAAPQLTLNEIRGLHDWFPWIPTDQLQPRLPLPNLTDLPWLAACVGFFLWAVFLLFTEKHPLWMVLRAFRYRGEQSVIYRIFAKVPRGFLNWALHLAVFYMFARNLFGFLKNNMAAAAAVGWPGSNLDFAGFASGFASAGWMLTHSPSIPDPDTFFAVARYLTWSACIVGCLLGYLHTIFSILWKPEPIRWLDFTLVGWMVNLLCYGAWANAVFRVFPHPAGMDPAITIGPLYYLQPTTELFLNVVYTLSIFNMGTKFGVMVDKGMVTRGYYSVVRHPSYTLEPLMFSVLYLNRVTAPFAALGLLAHPFMYWWRSERDEHFMDAANPDYAEYREKVRYKYIPGVW